MKNRNYFSLIAAGFTTLGLGLPTAHADAVYAGAAMATPDYRHNVNGVDGSGTGLSGSIFGGYQFTPNFALEAGVADLGRVRNTSGKIDGHAEYIDAVGLVPVGDKFALLGSVGATHVDLNTSNGDSSGNGVKLGVGAQYALTRNVALRGEYVRYDAQAFDVRTPIYQPTFGVSVAF
jgi:OOP family OmpA-OmpF porin